MEIACIAVDWGTSNRRAWALDGAGRVIGARHDDQGLIAINAAGGDFANSFAAFAQGWLNGAPVIMAGMVGSRAGWREAPYLDTPAALDDLSQARDLDRDAAPRRSLSQRDKLKRQW